MKRSGTRSDVLAFLGSLIAVVFLFMGFVELGFFPMIFFIMFCAAGIQDALRGQVNIFTFLPILFVPVFYPWAIFQGLFINVFVALMLGWLVLHILKKKGRIPKDELKFGFGDVIGVPYALIASWILLPFWGVVLFGASIAVLTLPLLRSKNRRLLPWLLPGLMACFVVAVLL